MDNFLTTPLHQLSKYLTYTNTSLSKQVRDNWHPTVLFCSATGHCHNLSSNWCWNMGYHCTQSV